MSVSCPQDPDPLHQSPRVWQLDLPLHEPQRKNEILLKKSHTLSVAQDNPTLLSTCGGEASTTFRIKRVSGYSRTHCMSFPVGLYRLMTVLFPCSKFVGPKQGFPALFQTCICIKVRYTLSSASLYHTLNLMSDVAFSDFVSLAGTDKFSQTTSVSLTKHTPPWLRTPVFSLSLPTNSSCIRVTPIKKLLFTHAFHNVLLHR